MLTSDDVKNKDMKCFSSVFKTKSLHVTILTIHQHFHILSPDRNGFVMVTGISFAAAG